MSETSKGLPSRTVVRICVTVGSFEVEAAAPMMILILLLQKKQFLMLVVCGTNTYKSFTDPNHFRTAIPRPSLSFSVSHVCNLMSFLIA
jgi:hypothetical protein